MNIILAVVTIITNEHYLHSGYTTTRIPGFGLHSIKSATTHETTKKTTGISNAKYDGQDVQWLPWK